MFDVIPVDQEWEDPSLPNKPLSSYTQQEKKAVLDRYDALRGAGKEEDLALSELDVSKDIITKWRMELVNNLQPEFQTQDLAEKSVPTRPASSYSKEEKKALLQRYDALLGEGIMMATALSQVGVSMNTIRKWRAEFTVKTNVNILPEEPLTEKKLKTSLAQDTCAVSKERPARKSSQALTPQGKRKILRNVVRQYTDEEKEGLLNKFGELVRAGANEQVALGRLGLTYNTIYQWRDEFAAKKQRAEQIAKMQILPPAPKTTSEPRQEIPAEEKSMAKTGKKGKKTKKEKKTKAVKPKKKNASDLKTKGKSAPRVAPSKVSKKSKRYSSQEKKEILANYNTLRESGTNAYDAAKKVGISYITIRSWEKREGQGRRTKGSGGMKPSSMSTASGNLSLVLPNGVAIEGLTESEVIKIIKNT